MPKSATDVMQEIIFSAVVDSLDALKSASKGVPNTLLRDLGAIHVNATFTDLPKEVQAAITASVRTAFNRLLKEGYSVAPRDAAPPRSPPRSPPGERGPHGGGPGNANRRRPPPRDGARPDPNRGQRPPRKPK